MTLENLPFRLTNSESTLLQFDWQIHCYGWDAAKDARAPSRNEAGRQTSISSRGRHRSQSVFLGNRHVSGRLPPHAHHVHADPSTHYGINEKISFLYYNDDDCVDNNWFDDEKKKHFLNVNRFLLIGSSHRHRIKSSSWQANPVWWTLCTSGLPPSEILFSTRPLPILSLRYQFQKFLSFFLLEIS